MSDAASLLGTLGGDDEWSRHAATERLREEGLAAFGGARMADLRAALDDEDAGRRNAARLALGALATPTSPDEERARQVLGEALRSPDPDLRVLASSALGESGNPEAVGDLVAALGDPEPNVVAAAADALGELRHPAAIGPLAALAGRGEFWVRAAGVVALGRIGDPRAVPALAEAAAERELAGPIVEALRSIDDPAALPLLGELAPDAGFDALLAAGAILCAHPDVPPPEWARAAAAAAADELRDRLEREDDPAAGRLLGIAGPPSALGILLDLVAPPRSSEAALAGVLGAPEGPRADAILDRLDGAEPATRVTLLSLMPPLADEERIRRLVPFLEDENSGVRAAAAETLARARSERALPLLQSHLERQRPAPEVLRAMGGLGGGACLALAPLLEDDDAAVRCAAAEALARCGGPEVADAIAAALDREPWSPVRAALLRAYGHAGGEEAVERLASALGDPDPEVRLGAIDGLAATGSPAALEPLREPLRDGTAEMLSALRALGDLGAAAGGALLLPYLGSSDLDVRRVAAGAAVPLAGSLPDHVVEELIGDEDDWVRTCAARILARGGGGGRARLRALAAEDPAPNVRAAARRALEGVG